MSELARKRMTSDEFIAWAMQQGGRYELVAAKSSAWRRSDRTYPCQAAYLAPPAEAIEAAICHVRLRRRHGG